VKSTKPIIIFFLIAFAGLIVLSGFCLAMEKHSCCQSKASSCPIQSVQKAASPSEAKALKCPGLRSATALKPVKKDASAAPAARKQSEAPEFILPNYHISASIAHQTNAPPQV
jgi:hypothetical protein